MINQLILQYFFVGLVASGILLTMVDIIGTGIYDLKEIKRLANAKKKRFSKQARQRPLISIIIPAYNEEKVIKRCLDSIAKSRYRKFEVVVVDDRSSDNTTKIAKEFIKNHPKKQIYVIKKHKNGGRGAAINTGYKRYAKGELIMALDADCVLMPNTLSNAVSHFTSQDITALASNVRIMRYPSILGLLQRIEWISSFRAKKFNAITNSEYIVGGSGAFYQRDIFRRLGGFNESMLTEDIDLSLAIAKLGNKKFRLSYGSDVIIYTEPVPSYRGLFKQRYRWKLGSLQAIFAHRQLIFARGEHNGKLLSWYRLPVVIWGEVVLLLQPFMFGYFLYLGIAYQRSLMIFITWATVTFMIAYTFWSDQHLPVKEKLNLSLYAPIMYVLFNILMIIQLLAVFKCLWNHKKITGKSKIKGAWTPPKRLAT